MYRAVSTETGKEVFGYYIHFLGNDFISQFDNNTTMTFAECWDSVHPQSIAQAIGINDKNDKMIYGSIPVEGVMSEGGDEAKQKLENNITRTGKIISRKGAFCIIGDDESYDYLHNLANFTGEYQIEITGSQFKSKEKRQ